MNVCYAVLITLLSVCAVSLLLFALQADPARSPHEDEAYTWRPHATKNEQRLAKLHHDCARPDSPCAPRFVQLRQSFVPEIIVVPRLRLLSCVIPKAMSTTMSRVMCALFDTATLNDTSDTYAKELNPCFHRNDFNSLDLALRSSLGIQLPDWQRSARDYLDPRPDWMAFVAVRDPLTRFVSAFKNKCLDVPSRSPPVERTALYSKDEWCYGCPNDDIHCFLSKALDRARAYASGTQRVVGFEDHHVFPQNWYCDFGRHMSAYRVGRYSGGEDAHFENDLERLLRDVGVDRAHRQILLNRFVRKKLNRSPWSSSNGGAQKVSSQQQLLQHVALGRTPVKRDFERELLSDPVSYSRLLRFYYYDYILFGFDFPVPSF